LLIRPRCRTPAVADRWNATAWWGGLVGDGVGWMILVALEVGLPTAQWWAALVVGLSAVSPAGLAGLLRRLRAGVRPAAGGLVLLLAVFPAAVATFALREPAGLSDYPVRRLWTILVLVS
jgi:hypothetical protein